MLDLLREVLLLVQQQLEGRGYVLGVGLQQREPLRHRRVDARAGGQREPRVPAHDRDRHAGVPQAAQHAEPVQVGVVVQPAAGRVPPDAADQADLLVVAEGVEAEAGAPGGVGRGVGGQVVEGFGGLVADGVVGAWGFSNTALWRVERAAGPARARGLAEPTGLQLRYSYLQPRPMVRDHEHDHRFGWITDEVLDYAEANPAVGLWAYSPLMSGAYERADRPVPDGFDHPGTARRLAVLAEVAAELGTSRSAVVLAWLAGGAPRVAPVAGVSSLDQLATAMAGIRLVLPAAARERLDAAW